MIARLIFLGATKNSPAARLVEPRGLEAGAGIPLTLKQGHNWSREDVTRVIVGSNPDRADVLLVDEPLTIGGEHARFYLNHAEPAASHLRPMKNSLVVINGEPQKQFEWIHPKNGDEIQLGAWRFRFEMEG